MCETVMRFWVSVPVLSEQMTDTEPRLSTSCSFLTRQFLEAIFFDVSVSPTCSYTVIIHCVRFQTSLVVKNSVFMQHSVGNVRAKFSSLSLKKIVYAVVVNISLVTIYLVVFTKLCRATSDFKTSANKSSVVLHFYMPSMLYSILISLLALTFNPQTLI